MKYSSFSLIILLSVLLLAVIYITTCSVELPVSAQDEGLVNTLTITKSPKTVAGHRVFENISSKPGIVEVELTASPERLSLKPGSESDVFAYNGMIPGPLLEAFEGDSIIVHFKNNLSEDTTVHWHGVHLPFIMDGSPFHPIAPGESYIYRFRLHEGTAGTYWYHPHPHHRTAWQVGMGLYGGIIVRDRNDPIPGSLNEYLLLLADNRFDENGEIHFAEANSYQKKVDDMNGREGDVLFVNDKIMPTLSIRSGEVQRWRIVNASGARTYRLSLEDHNFILIGSDGGLFEHPEEVNEIVLGNGERAELLVRGTGTPGSEVVLQTLPYDRYMPMWKPEDWNQTRELLKLSYTSEPPVEEQFEVPETLRKIPALKIEDATDIKIMRMSNGKINSKTMDMKRIDETANLGDTEIWDIRNLVGMDHTFHIHGYQFQVIDRNGVPVKQRKWKDVVNVPKFEKARFIIQYKNYTGKWMYHCHILDHEDQGMMGVLEVK